MFSVFWIVEDAGTSGNDHYCGFFDRAAYIESVDRLLDQDFVFHNIDRFDLVYLIHWL